MLELLRDYPILDAFWMTIKLTVLSAIGALVIGSVIAIMRFSPISAFQRIGAAYVTIVRNTPLTLLVFFFFFVNYMLLGWSLLPKTERTSSHAFVWGVLALAVYHSTFVAESLRSGVNTVPVGQAEAARAIGLDFWQSLREVLLPQAFRGAIAPLGNTLIALTKNTTVVATISVAEAAYQMKYMIEERPDILYSVFFLIAIGFVILTLPTGVAFTRLSKKYAVQR